MTAPYPGEGSFEIIVQYGVQITEMSRVTDIDADVFETDCKTVNVASVHWQAGEPKAPADRINETGPGGFAQLQTGPS